jgi:hypothetical protein
MSDQYKIQDFVQDVLGLRFNGDHHKTQINSEDSDKLNFACPYCGDSEKDPTKKRGNLYLTTQSYKCFNDGCLTWVPLNKFISTFALKYSLNLPSMEDRKESRRPIRQETKRGFLIEFLMNPKVKNSLVDFSSLQSRFFLTPCKDAPIDSPVYQYLSSRNIFNLPSFEQTCYYDNRMDKIYIFNLDLRSGKVLGVSLRRIDGGSGPKYNIRNYSEFKKTGLIRGVDEDVISKIDAINNYFNILNINFSYPVIVTEGQIDAMFLRNSIATTGVTKSKALLGTLLSKNNALILFDNDKAGRTESMKLIKNGYKVFMWANLIDDLKAKYPKSIKDILNIKDVNDLFNFYKSLDPDISFDQFNDTISKYFTESIYDMIGI